MKKQWIEHSCAREWENLGVGDLYSLETHASKDHQHHTKYFWLCPDCAIRFDIYIGEAGIVSVCPRSVAAINRIPSPDYDLRLVMRGSSNRGASLDQETIIKSNPVANVKEETMIVPLLARITALCKRHDDIQGVSEAVR